MTTVRITLPEELASKAATAGLLSHEAMESMLRKPLRRAAGQPQRTMCDRAPAEVLTPVIEKESAQFRMVVAQECCAEDSYALVEKGNRPFFPKQQTFSARSDVLTPQGVTLSSYKRPPSDLKSDSISRVTTFNAGAFVARQTSLPKQFANRLGSPRRHPALVGFLLPLDHARDAFGLIAPAVKESQAR
jgi:hypothetical protein